MFNFKMAPRGKSSLVVFVLAIFLFSSVLMTQPLGLFYKTKAQPAENPDQDLCEDPLEEPLPSFDPNWIYVNDAELYNRSRDEFTDDTFEGDLDPTEDVVDLPEDYTPVETEELEPLEIVRRGELMFDDADYTLYIGANKLNVRAAPTLDSTVLGTVYFGDTLACEGESANWMKIRLDGKMGFVKAEFTSKSMVFKDVNEAVYVKSNTLNLRSGPSVDDEVLVKLKHDDALKRTGIGNGWSRVVTSGGKSGFVSSEHLTKTAPYVAPAPKAPSSSGQKAPTGGTTVSGSAGKIVELAYKALGVPYRHAKNSLSAGFDCTGLTYWAYGQIGVKVPRVTSGYYNAGKGVSSGDMRPGDVIGWDAHPRRKQRALTHVGIYVGNGMMIHASSSKGKVVLQSVSEYQSWGCKILSIRRFVSG